ncbi:acyl-CoA dehydrogenase family protein [Corynebacterium gerontici]|uniref:glutaryl-CoA dehydrogenase (ETF) n=1 Tax=Corynebacterium gerontici TaxID=2079234 RepID=A0A3G6J0A2_9CORY|nr:acyl-CoA dehydrogenase family protein [Corynebacterium gerontici]AZA11465.1 Acyl-CoA dehydrogenase [Corynebacterium gerontici]
MQHSMLDPSTDYYGIFHHLDETDLRAWERARKVGQRYVERVNADWEAARVDREVVRELGAQDLYTDGLEIEGHEQLTPLAAGLVSMELSRADGSLGTIHAIMGGLVLRSLLLYGSEEQQNRYVEGICRGELLGGFGLTEPDHGSDSVSLETSARVDGDEYVLNGQKRWIGFGANGDFTIIWARLEDGSIGGFIVDQNTPGYRGEVIEGKAVLRAVHQALITLENVRVPKSARLPGVSSFKDIARILSATRSSVAWAALGHAIACYESALEHAKTRIQFGRPLVKNQLIQHRLSVMLQSITSMVLHCKQLAVLDAQGCLEPEQASMAKGFCTSTAREVASDARDMLGGSGILLENHVVRHWGDLETLHTYEGTATIQELIVGRRITGVGAFV